MTSWSNFAYVWRTEGWKWGINIAYFGWVKLPWRWLRIKLAELCLKILRVEDYFG